MCVVITILVFPEENVKLLSIKIVSYWSHLNVELSTADINRTYRRHLDLLKISTNIYLRIALSTKHSVLEWISILNTYRTCTPKLSCKV